MPAAWLETEPLIVQAPIPTTQTASAEFISIVNGKSTTNRAFNISAFA